MALKIEKKQIIHNRKTRNSAIAYIVIHDTQNTNKGADASAHFRYFNGGERGASADFFVDDTHVLQVNDYKKYYTYHVGDGKGKRGIKNQNSVGIELCVNQDGDFDKAYQNAVALTKQLMAELSIPATRVVRHFDASGKNCPASMSAQNWQLWRDFQRRITEDTTMEHKFCDIRGHYAEKHIAELYKMGVIGGIDETHFAPNEPIKRADVAIMVRNAIRYITGR